MPAVPSASGVADVFAFRNDGTVQAITSDGTTAWTADVGLQASVLADFQGGLVALSPVYGPAPYSIVRFDGATGQSVFTYTINDPSPDYRAYVSGMAVHTDGTIFVLLWAEPSLRAPGPGPWSVIGIDANSGGQKFSVALPANLDAGERVDASGQIMIAGDGYAYVPYVFWQADVFPAVKQLKLLRVSSAGAFDIIDVKTLTADSDTAELEVGFGSMITNADTGVWVTWSAVNHYSWEPGQAPVPPDRSTYGIAVTSGTGVSVLDAPLAGQAEPVLQAQDGSFVGSYGFDMVSFDQSGNVRWMVPNYSPLMATADGGVIATTDYVSATVFDQNGNATGQIPNMPIYSWKGAYQTGSVDSVLPVLDLASTIATSFSAVPGGNLTGNGFSLAHHTFGLVFCGSNPGDDGTCPPTPGATPVSFSYLADIGDTNYSQAVDFSQGHPDWVTTIKAQAYNQYKAAFDHLPAIVAVKATASPSIRRLICCPIV